MVDSQDIEALVALLMRAVRIADERKVVEEEKRVYDEKSKEAQAKILDLNLKNGKLVAAVSVFELEKPEEGNIWDAVRLAIGTERYNQALVDAKRPQGIKAIEDKSSNAEGAPEQTEVEVRSSTTEAIRKEAEGGVTIPNSEPDALRVADVVLDLLRSKSPDGARMAEVKAYLETRGITGIHEKTPGMTLYRLSQEDPPRVFRDGRTWFLASPSKGGKGNPGAVTPGPDVDAEHEGR